MSFFFFFTGWCCSMCYKVSTNKSDIKCKYNEFVTLKCASFLTFELRLATCEYHQLSSAAPL